MKRSGGSSSWPEKVPARGGEAVRKNQEAQLIPPAWRVQSVYVCLILIHQFQFMASVTSEFVSSPAFLLKGATRNLMFSLAAGIPNPFECESIDFHV